MNLNNMKLEAIDYSSDEQAATLTLHDMPYEKTVKVKIFGIEYHEIDYRVGDVIDLNIVRKSREASA
jgi:hypothetical protein